jgi:hypothetical protein
MNLSKLIQLKPDEEVIAVIHEDVVPHVPWIVFLFIWIVAPFFFLFPLFRQGPIGIVIFFALTLSGLVVGLRRLFSWQHSVFIITDHRVVDVEQRGLFDRTYSEALYGDIEDVTFRVKGIVPTIFRYGTLRVKTAGNAADLEIRRVREPSKFHDLIRDLREEAAVSVPRTLRTRKLKELTESMSDEEVDRLIAESRQTHQQEAIEQVFGAEREES